MVVIDWFFVSGEVVLVFAEPCGFTFIQVVIRTAGRKFGVFLHIFFRFLMCLLGLSPVPVADLLRQWMFMPAGAGLLLVIFMLHRGEVVGVLDADSDAYDSFDETDRRYLEQVVQLIDFSNP